MIRLDFRGTDVGKGDEREKVRQSERKKITILKTDFKEFLNLCKYFKEDRKRKEQKASRNPKRDITKKSKVLRI